MLDEDIYRTKDENLSNRIAISRHSFQSFPTIEGGSLTESSVV